MSVLVTSTSLPDDHSDDRKKIYNFLLWLLKVLVLAFDYDELMVRI